MEKRTVNAENISSQEVLRRLEAMCTAEEPVACMAACPLHVDARELCALIAAGDLKAAWKVYRKTVPFGGLLSRVCTAPCQQLCVRREYGGAVQIGELERAMAAAADIPAKAPAFLTKKKQRAAVVGGGMAGLTAAHDLARKGYQVTILEKSRELGGSMRRAGENPPEPAVIESELKILTGLKVKIELERMIPVDSIESLTGLLAEFDGVYISCDTPLGDHSDRSTQQVGGYPMLLAGTRRDHRRTDESTVYQMYDGRSAAATLDRLFQQVNLSVGREKEGSFKTTLITNTNHVSSEPVTESAGAEYLPAEAAAEAARCMQCHCDLCVEKCGFLQEYGKNPRQYVREVYNNLSIAMGAHHANTMINTCALCHQCQAICPNGLDMAEVFRAAREHMTRAGKMPPRAFEFGLLDLEYSQSETCFLARHQDGRERSELLFFPGCQLSASEPELTAAVYEDLCRRNQGGVALMLSCCGIPAIWAGKEDAFEATKKQIYDTWNELGQPTAVTACPNCAATLHELNIETESLYELLNRGGVQPQEQDHTDRRREDHAREKPQSGQFLLHHVCGARYDPAWKDGVMAAAGQHGISLIERDELYEQSPCCGFGGMVPVVDAGVADKITGTALEQLETREKLPVLTYCVNCRDRYLSQGRASSHLLELLYPEAAVFHRAPTWSSRQDNRASLKRELLEKYWGEQSEMEEQTRLYMTDELEEKIDRLHILHSDIAAVIQHAEASGARLADEETGRFTAYRRIGNVTFWTEYRPQDDGFRVFNAYSHRMDFMLGDDMTKGKGDTIG